MDSLEYLEMELEALFWIYLSSRYLFLIFEEKYFFVFFFVDFFRRNFFPTYELQMLALKQNINQILSNRPIVIY